MRIEHAELLRVLHYEPSTGVFTWRVRLANGTAVGDVAGTCYANRRRYIAIGKHRYFAAHLAWLYVTGHWPSAQVDHRNLQRDDNRFENLRLATNQQNAANRGKLKNNTSGFKGVIAVRDKYRARIRVNDKLIHLGYFDDPKAAHEAYAAAAREHFGEFARAA